MLIRQMFTTVLPQAGFGVEVINDAAQHASIEFPTVYLQEKVVYVYGIITVGAPGPLNVWVEIAPDFLFGIAPGAAFYAPLGVPTVLAVTGNTPIAWTTHSEWSRIVAQAPGAGAAAIWTCVIILEAKTP